ncbi:MAG: hypothetical protein DBY06_05285 [Clostridiales bacterium]|nr:MAG: hypothetical protein DBY06_05285 [Clostridiales bacterium]
MQAHRAQLRGRDFETGNGNPMAMGISGVWPLFYILSCALPQYGFHPKDGGAGKGKRPGQILA